ncbi:MAG: hypothetical protein P8R42_18640 [Candidatus Binatia bacterium]|nr:hypothetical protein [Candidatus Binatia bacterium]
MKLLDDLGGVSGLQPKLTYLSRDGTSTVMNTQVVSNACSQQRSAFKRRFPFSGTFYLVVEADLANGCGGGSYKLAVTTPGGTQPVLIANDIDPAFP